MPPLAEVRAVSRAVAEAVAITAEAQGLAQRADNPEEAIACLDAATWTPSYHSSP